MRYDFSGVVETGQSDFVAVDVRERVDAGFADCRDVWLVSVKATAQQYVAPQRAHTALDRQVLVVAVPGEVGDWAAYIGVVPGMCHAHEVEAVEREGTKLSLNMAKLLFPQFDPEQYRL